MHDREHTRINSGAPPEKVAADLQPLIEFAEEGMPIDELNEMLEKRLLPHLMRYDLPGFQSMFNAFPEKGAEFGAKIALAYNQGVTNWQVSPGGAMLEELCCRALCRLYGFDDESDATFMYSGTYANQEAVYLALHRYAEQHGFDLSREGLGGFTDISRLALLTSVDAHFSIRHAVRMLGLGEHCIIPVPVDGNRRIDISALKKIIRDIGNTRDIFCIVATAGTTSTGAVDPIESISEVCGQTGAWLHVDGAYGLAYSLVPEWKHLFHGVEKADSVSWDPHKQLGIPIPNSVLFIRRWQDFNRMAVYSGYFNREEATEPNPGIKSPPSTRPFSALSLVTSLRYQGMKQVIARLHSPLLAIRTAAEKVAKEPDIQLLHTPDTGIFCFRIIPEGVLENRLDELQNYVYERIMSGGERSISVTNIDKITTLRLLAISPSVTCDALMETVNEVRRISADFITGSK